MIIDCIADTHGHYPKLEGGDLLIVAGDLTARDTIVQHAHFADWLCKQNYRKKVVIAGNHDTILEDGYIYGQGYTFKTIDGEGIKFDFLCDSGTEFEGLKIWGSPWTLKFKGMNPACMAFTCDTEEELAKKWEMIPDDVDILVTHSPPHGILDWNKNGVQCGSTSLFEKSRKLTNLKLFCFGHIHEAYSMINTQVMTNSLPMLLSPKKPNSLPIIVNASHVNEHYKPVNKPVRVIL